MGGFLGFCCGFLADEEAEEGEGLRGGCCWFLWEGREGEEVMEVKEF